jgi:hypothetical protein
MNQPFDRAQLTAAQNACMDEEKTISRPLAPEDIRPGDYVSLLHVTTEFVPFFCAEDLQFRRIEPVRITCMPRSIEPMEVVEVCLPFVLVRRPDDRHETLDVRRHQLARLSERFGKKAFKRIKSQPEVKRFA